MPSHLALLRGINVGKAKRVAMADLKAVCTGLGFTEVRTLLNSGNVVFTGRGTPKAMAADLETAIAGKLGVTSRIIVLTQREVAAIVADNSLGKLATNPSRLMVAVTAAAADLKVLAPLAKQRWSPEALAIGSRAAYFWCPDSILDSPLATAGWNLLCDRVTSRNWSTITKLEALLAG